MGSRITGKTPGDFLYNLLRPLAWLLLHVVCRYQVSGSERIPATGPLLIVANHLSWFDPILLGSIVPRRIWFFTKIEAFAWPVVGWLLRRTGQIPVARGGSDRAALEQALTYLYEGKAVAIFPEGTVARKERMIAAHTGVAMLALRSGATVLPIAHTGTRRILRKHGGLRPSITVQVGLPYVPILPEGMPRKVGLQTITKDIMEQIATMLPPEQRGVYADQIAQEQEL
ncbi:MAG TPA: lysophospholipid acyltransferase family protein [Ktedonosporobacter sp.]|nr:lysophospholipid acyltransferase family protein [Ktedonosporobacter sp.]